MTRHTFIVELEQAATAAQRAEISFRRNIALEIERHERERQYAFRRLDLAKRMAAAAMACEARDAAIAAQVSTLKSEFGWYGENDHRKRICDAWEAVADAVWHETSDNAADGADAADRPSVADTIRAFEAWYQAEFNRPFFELLDQEVPEMPVVEF